MDMYDMYKVTAHVTVLCVSVVVPMIAMADDRHLSLKRGAPLTKGPTVTAAPDHLRMSSAIKVKDTYYLYSDYIRHDDPNAPGSYSSSLHLFTSTNLVDWTHRGEVIGSQSDDDSFGCVNVDVLCHDGSVYIYYLGIGKNDFESRKRNEGWNVRPDDRSYLTSTIMVAESESPLGPFKKRTPLLRAGPKGSWDHWKVLDPKVIKVDGQFRLYFKGFNTKFHLSRKIGFATSSSPTGPFKKYEKNPILDWSGSGQTGIDVTVPFNHRGNLGMLSLTFDPRRHVYLTSNDGIQWHVHNEMFSKGMDIGLVKDHDNNLLPYYIQSSGKPLSLTLFNLQIRKETGQPEAAADADTPRR